MATLPDLVTQVDVEAALGRAATDSALLARLIRDASAALREQLGMPLSPVSGDVVALDSSGAQVVLLPNWPVLAVTSVVIDGQTASVSDYEWSAVGALRRAGGWPVGYRKVVVTYDHGYNPIPASVVSSVAAAVAARYDAIFPAAAGPAAGGAFTSVDDVLSLVPEATVDQPSTDPLTYRTVTTADVVQWIVQAEGYVLSRCAGWDAMPAGDLTVFRAAARRIASRLAAADLESARFPERSAPSDSSHPEWLRRSATEELDALVAATETQRGGGTNDWVFSQVGIEPRHDLRWSFQ